MPNLTRRSMLAAGSALAAVSAVSASAQQDPARSLTGKTFLVTGTSSGFGRLGALHYARLGASVFATMRNLPRPEADSLRQEAAREKLDLHILELDVLSDEQVASAVAEAERRAGGALDVVVNNAGIVIGGPVEAHDMEATRLAFDTNVFGVQRVIRAALPAMRARKAGLIVNVSSQQGRVIMPAGGLYAPTKFALEALSEQLAYELVPHGIDVAIIQPGGFPTRVGENRARYQNALAARVPERHAAGYPEMIAALRRPPQPLPPPEARQQLSGEAAAYLLADPLMVPQAIAEIAAMPAGRRPLRRAVHPGNKPQLEINRVAAESQVAWLGSGPYGPWVRAVHD
jgi:NAD(P)-dependent dehydrogenase (short-subunit alcohol dehydrogenase family)